VVVAAACVVGRAVTSRPFTSAEVLVLLARRNSINPHKVAQCAQENRRGVRDLFSPLLTTVRPTCSDADRPTTRRSGRSSSSKEPLPRVPDGNGDGYYDSG
jgi:hypothetical protein